MHGPLHEIGLVDLLQLLERGRRSGVLQIVGPDPTVPREVRIAAGRIVAVEPEAGDVAVDTALVERSLATADRVREVPVASRERMRGVLARRALERMLGWTRGHFDFEEHAGIAGPLDLTADMLVRELVDAEHRRLDLSETFDHFRAVPGFVAAADMPATPLPPFDPLAWRILDAVDGVRTVAAIAARLDEPVEDVAERIAMLLRETILLVRAVAADVDVAARAAVEAGRYDEAVERLRDRITAVPGDDEAWRLLGLAEVGAGRFDQAIEAWNAWRSSAGPRATEATTLIQAARTMLEAMREHRD